MFELCSFTIDPSNGYYDIPNGLEACDGDCEMVYAERELKRYGDRMLCDSCHPECPECGNPSFDGNEDGYNCVQCELDATLTEGAEPWFDQAYYDKYVANLIAHGAKPKVGA